MAKFCRLSDENLKLIEEEARRDGLSDYVHIEGIGKTKAKELIKIQKDSAVAEYKTNKPDTVNVFIYEEAFDMLNDEQKQMLLHDAFNGIGYDFEKEKLIIGCPQITVSVNGRAKWGDALINAAEAGVHAIMQIEDKDKERKEMERARNGKK